VSGLYPRGDVKSPILNPAMIEKKLVHISKLDDEIEYSYTTQPTIALADERES
jgi:hypothetical protein